MRDRPDIAELSKNVIISPTPKRLDVSNVDQDGRSMFPDGSTHPNERTRRQLERLAPAFRHLPNRIAITGFTASDRPDHRPSAQPWEISANRAISVREVLAGAGVPDDRSASVTGTADTEPLFPDNPFIAPNGRVTVTLLREAPPTPIGRSLP